MEKILLAMGMLALLNVAQAEDTIKVALAGPTTGPVTQYGTMQILGAEMAAEKLNEAGGMNGKKIVTEIFDDVCEPKQAVTVANQIANDGIQFVIGHLCSASTNPAATIYDDEGILMITAASTDPKLTKQGYVTIFRTIGTDTQSAPASARYIMDTLEPKHIALLHDNRQYGQGLAKAVKKILEENDVTVDVFEGVNRGQMDFSALVTKLKRADIDFVYWGGFHPELGLIIRQGVSQGFMPQYMGADGVDNPDIFAIAGDAADNLLATVSKNFSEDPKNADLVASFKAEGKDPSGPFVLPSYAALEVIVDAANRAHSNDPEDIADAIRAGSFDTPVGELSYQENGDLKNFQSVIYKLHPDGSRELMSE